MYRPELNEHAQRFLDQLRRSLQQGHVSVATEAHLRNMFRKLRGAEVILLTRQVDEEIERLEREAWMLKKLRTEAFGS